MRGRYSFAQDNRFDKFTERARKALALAQEEAQHLGHNYVGTEHILVAMAMHGVRRIVAVSSWGTGESRARVPWPYDRIIFPLILEAELADKERQERLLCASDRGFFCSPSQPPRRPKHRFRATGPSNRLYGRVSQSSVMRNASGIRLTRFCWRAWRK